MSDTPDKTVFSTAHKQHLSDAMKGKAKSPEHRAKIAESAKRRWAEKRESEAKQSKTVVQP